MTRASPGAAGVPCAGGLVRLAGPAPVAAALAELLSVLTIASDALPLLDVVIAPDARTADGVLDGRLRWSITLPAATPVAALVGQIVGTLTTLLKTLLFVHAGVVAFGRRGMVIVGESGAGKTSTVAALLRRGATYLSDEVALLDPAAGVVLPFAVPMAVKPWTRKAAGVLPRGRMVLQESGVEFWLPDKIESGPIPVEAFVLLRHQEQGPRLTPISRAGMLLALAEHASSFKQRPRLEHAFSGFAKLVRNAESLVFETLHPATDADLLAALGRGHS